MKTRHLFVAAILLVLPAISGATPATPEYDVFLLPITATSVPGAFGSVWSSELWVRRDDVHPVAEIAPRLGPICECPDPGGTIEIDQPFRTGFFSTRPGETPGGLLYVSRVGREHVHLSLRLKEVSVALPVQLPVVPAEDFRAATVQIAGIPVRGDARVTLRVYGLDPEIPGNVRIAVVRENPSVPLGVAYETILTLGASQRSFQLGGVSVPARPAAAQIDLTEAIGRIGGETVIVEVTPMTETMRIWAFASITANDTQQFVTRLPQ